MVPLPKLPLKHSPLPTSPSLYQIRGWYSQSWSPSRQPGRLRSSYLAGFSFGGLLSPPRNVFNSFVFSWCGFSGSHVQPCRSDAPSGIEHLSPWTFVPARLTLSPLPRWCVCRAHGQRQRQQRAAGDGPDERGDGPRGPKRPRVDSDEGDIDAEEDADALATVAVVAEVRLYLRQLLELGSTENAEMVMRWNCRCLSLLASTTVAHGSSHPAQLRGSLEGPVVDLFLGLVQETAGVPPSERRGALWRSVFGDLLGGERGPAPHTTNGDWVVAKLCRLVPDGGGCLRLRIRSASHVPCPRYPHSPPRHCGHGRCRCRWHCQRSLTRAGSTPRLHSPPAVWTSFHIWHYLCGTFTAIIELLRACIAQTKVPGQLMR